jgi:hypothetical protein
MATRTTTNNGDWWSTSNWQDGLIPDTNDVASVGNNMTVGAGVPVLVRSITGTGVISTQSNLTVLGNLTDVGIVATGAVSITLAVIGTWSVTGSNNALSVAAATQLTVNGNLNFSGSEYGALISGIVTSWNSVNGVNTATLVSAGTGAGKFFLRIYTGGQITLLNANITNTAAHTCLQIDSGAPKGKIVLWTGNFTTNSSYYGIYVDGEITTWNGDATISGTGYGVRFNGTLGTWNGDAHCGGTGTSNLLVAGTIVTWNGIPIPTTTFGTGVTIKSGAGSVTNPMSVPTWLGLRVLKNANSSRTDRDSVVVAASVVRNVGRWTSAMVAPNIGTYVSAPGIGSAFIKVGE